MHPDSGMTPEDDIQQALEQASNPTEAAQEPAGMQPGEVMAESSRCPLMGLRYAMAKCGMKAEKYPWQTTMALLLCASCAWICSYFGATMLVGLLLFAVFCDD